MKNMDNVKVEFPFQNVFIRNVLSSQINVRLFNRVNTGEEDRDFAHKKPPTIVWGSIFHFRYDSIDLCVPASASSFCRLFASRRM